MDAIVAWIRETALSEAIRSQVGWVWPVCESLHFIGLSLLLGITGVFDLRLLGLLRGVPVRAVKAMLPWALAGFGINLLTGMVFLIGQPQQYATNGSWWFKFLFLVVAGLNALLFERMLSERVLALAPDEPMPVAAKVVAVVSIVAWLAVLYFGRMVPYLFPDFRAGV